MKTFILSSILLMSASASYADARVTEFAAKIFLKTATKILVLKAEKDLESSGSAGREEMKKVYIALSTKLPENSGFSVAEGQCVSSQVLQSLDVTFDAVYGLAFATLNARMSLLNAQKIEDSIKAVATVKSKNEAASFALAKVLSPCF